MKMLRLKLSIKSGIVRERADIVPVSNEGFYRYILISRVIGTDDEDESKYKDLFAGLQNNL